MRTSSSAILFCTLFLSFSTAPIRAFAQGKSEKMVKREALICGDDISGLVPQGGDVSLPYRLQFCPGSGQCVSDSTFIFGGYFRTLKDCQNVLTYLKGMKFGVCTSVIDEDPRYRGQWFLKCGKQKLTFEN